MYRYVHVACPWDVHGNVKHYFSVYARGYIAQFKRTLKQERFEIVANSVKPVIQAGG